MKAKQPSLNQSHVTSSPLFKSRRQFVQGLVGGGILSTGLVGSQHVYGGPETSQTHSPEELRGKTFNLVIDETMVNFTGSAKRATAINGSIPGPTLRWKEGDEVTINVSNHLTQRTSIHWHGMILPFQMDGVPGISFPGIAPGETFQYRFKVQQSGTYWYHSHSAFQEMTGLYGAIIIEPASGERIESDRDHVIMLSEWTDEDPMYVFQKLKTMGHLYNFNQPTLPGLIRDITEQGLGAAMSKRDMFNVMRMKPTDLADLSAETLTYLVNGVTPAGNDTRLFEKGQRVRLRIINAAGNTFFDVRIPDLPMTVVQVDGMDVEPVTVDEFRLGAGETYDVVVTPSEDAYTFFAETMDRTGHARATLSTRHGLSAPVPERREVQWLSMADMMGNMSGSGHDMAGMNHGDGDQGNMQMAMLDPVRGRHATSEFGPSTDMRVDFPRTNLDDPGVGLREASHRVLTLADLRSIGGPFDDREPEREIELHLTGNMERYSWSIDGLEYGQSTPIHFRHGERLRVHLHNDTMMTHPMHLHGMWSDLEDENGNFLARRHTLPVQPAQRVSFSVTADALGRWAWHCHLLLHMDAGMFREVVVV
ncbi:MAG: copper resistance protein CopA [SAR86 cluster bacterium]|uniref:Copper resistance protein CopA n=1 Tax=SAR86 cluster bacterium TaxID=2030880 RepID=A0A2A4X364_9GAMM|nr:MAG: copper resistance protein CopA [SAR86 cluster bacterium]